MVVPLAKHVATGYMFANILDTAGGIRWRCHPRCPQKCNATQFTLPLNALDVAGFFLTEIMGSGDTIATWWSHVILSGASVDGIHPITENRTMAESLHTMLYKYDCMNHQMQQGVLQISICAILQDGLIECYFAQVSKGTGSEASDVLGARVGPLDGEGGGVERAAEVELVVVVEEVPQVQVLVGVRIRHGLPR